MEQNKEKVVFKIEPNLKKQLQTIISSKNTTQPTLNHYTDNTPNKYKKTNYNPNYHKNKFEYENNFKDNKNLNVIEQAKKRREELENEAFAQDIKLKKDTLITLFLFLALETIGIFLFAYMQATQKYGFKLEEWSFKLLMTATITQITVMIQIAVKHLFPNK